MVDVNPVHAPGHFFVSYHTISIPSLHDELAKLDYAVADLMAVAVYGRLM